jgi:hypothetical protein
MTVWLMLSILPLSMAEFDNCARASGVWAGLDQGVGVSQPHAVTYSNGNIYIAGYAMGNLSFHSQHKDGTYKDHAGSSSTADSHTDVTIHHETGSFAAGKFASDAVSQHGMDATIYQISKDGEPVKVFGVDVLPSDENFQNLASEDGGSVNGRFGGLAELYGIDAFDSQPNMVAAGGLFRGKLTFPMNDGSKKVLNNTRDAGYSDRTSAPHLLWGGSLGFVTKVNMATGKAMWATDEGLNTPEDRFYVRAVATTAAGHVLATSDERGKVYKGKMVKFDGTTGAKVWDITLDSAWNFYGLEGDAAEETAYLTGYFKGTDVAPFSTKTNFTGKGDAFVTAIDVSGSSGPVAKWLVQIGRGNGYSVKASGEYLYAAGTLSGATALGGSCAPLTGQRGGYLVKLKKSDGACVWAKDTPMARSGVAVTDGTHVWAFNSGSSAMVFDETHTVYPNGKNRDVFVAKYNATDGAGQWAAALGGTGSDRVSDAVMTPEGPVFVGYAQSETITVGSLTINNLQHKKAMAESGKVGATWGPNRGGETALFSMLLSKTDQSPSCISSCPSGLISDANTALATGKCYAHNECLDDGAFSSFVPCFNCKPSTAQKVLQGPVTANHCYFKDTCVEKGTMAPSYKRYNDASVCEWCDPTVDANDWSLKSGFVHDRSFATMIENPGRRGAPDPSGKPGQANLYGMLFELESNGCQVMPSMAMPASKSASLVTALAKPTSGTIAAVGALASAAIAAVKSAKRSNDHVEIAWARFLGDAATCTKSSKAKDVCENTPSEVAHAMGIAFETNLHYGHSVAGVKVQQGLTVLKSALAGSNDSLVAELRKDVVAHMLIPYYQGVIMSAHGMDSDKKGSAADGAAYWKVINDALGGGFHPADRASLTSMFESAATGTFNHCAASSLLLKNLPAASQLKYGAYAREGTMQTMDAAKVVHLTATDVGTLKESRVDGQPKKCIMPPPPSPSKPPPPVGAPMTPSNQAAMGLTTGELVGVVVGAAVAGLLLLAFLALVLRAFLCPRPGKPIFTCLDVESKAPPSTSTSAATDSKKVQA